ncbi:glycosyltransferase family 2 protein [Elizabethkingia anophelis]|nr:glycosyltransferase family 2 protein [Elizabethkingia anophelis]
MQYKVSLIVPVYKVEAYIETCVRSIFDQTFKSLQIIFIDDCGLDSSIDIINNTLSEYPNREKDVLILKNDKNEGASFSRNIGLANATGKYIAFCDADDWIEKNTIEIMYRTIESEYGDIVWTDFYYTSLEDEILQIQNIKEKKEDCIKALMCEKMHGALWNKMYRRGLFFENKISFPEGKDMWEDLYTNVRLFSFAKKVTYLSEAFYHYIQYNSHSIGSSLSEKKLQDIIENTNATELFLKENNILQTYESEVYFLKLAAKQTLLFTCEKENFKKWIYIYPESNKYIMKFKSLSLHLRLLGWAALNRIWILIDLWIFMKHNKTKNENSSFSNSI